MKQHTLALAIGWALAGAILPAWGAEPDTNDQTTESTAEESSDKQAVDEVIEVRGIRSSLKEGQEIKKLADNVVDAIVAEDIGKFPDENIAEALQRIPGVSVSRSNGEGQTVTVRGLTGNYNITTLNGRKLASDNPSRDFNYDVIASELISQVQVHKTPQAHLTEGGIGAVIDVKTARPLDMGEFVLAGSLRGAYNERAESLDPRASLLISDTFLDDTVGALFSLTHSKYTNRHDAYGAASFHAREVDIGADGNVEYANARFPGYVQLTSYEDERERTGSTFALQYRPLDNLDITLDGLYSQYDIDSRGKQLSVVTYSEWWLPAPNGTYTDALIGDDGWADRLAWEGPALMDIVDTRSPRRNTTWQLGLNFAWMLDDLTLTLDMAESRAKNENNGDNKYIVARSGIQSASVDWTSGGDVPDILLSEPVTPDGTFGAWYTNSDGIGVEDKTRHFAFDGVWENEGLFSKLMFGVGYDTQKKDRLTFRSVNPSIFAGENLDKVNAPSSALVNFYGHEWWQLPSSVMLPGGINDFMNGIDANIPDDWASVDVDALYDYLATLDPAAAALLQPELKLAQTFSIEESIFNAYVETNLTDSVFDMPYLVNMGLRYVRTDVTSSGYTQNIHKLEFDANGDPVDDSWMATQPVAEDYSYDNWLPSINAKLDVTDELVLRASWSQVISRPSLWELSPYTYIGITPNEQGVRYLEMSVPDLKPYTADQFDTALEWYYSDEGTLALATFYKDVASFIKWDKTQEEIGGQPFEVWRPYNDDRSSLIRGFEIAWLQTFDALLPFEGLGIQANYTYNDSVSAETDDEGNHKPFPGLSDDQYNLVAFYEHEGFEARIAYNYRSGFYLGEAWSWVDNDWLAEERWANASSWLDMSMSYDINDNFTVTADVTNLEDKVYTEYLADPSHITYAASYGRRFSLGLRARF